MSYVTLCMDVVIFLLNGTEIFDVIERLNRYLIIKFLSYHFSVCFVLYVVRGLEILTKQLSKTVLETLCDPSRGIQELLETKNLTVVMH